MDAQPLSDEALAALEAELEALKERRPELGDELERIARAWRLAAAARVDPSATISAIASLEERSGAKIDPAITLDTVPQHDPQALTESLLERLAQSAGPSRYRLDGEVGRGGMGAVLRVWDGGLRRAVAMKVLLGGDPTPSATALSRFLEEAQITGQLEHPGIVPVHELGLDPSGRAFFTMRLVREGRTFADVLTLVAAETDGWSRTRALEVLLKVCDAIGFAHAKNVVHRDLKPSNVMVGPFGVVYVVDWGLAKVLGRDGEPLERAAGGRRSTRAIETERGTSASALRTRDGVLLGTPVYMSPEQARGDVGAVDRRADVYAIGAMLYELLTGRMPYLAPGENVPPAAVVARLLAGPPEPIASLAPDAPAELVAICERAMAREPDRRYANVARLGADLRAFLEQRVVSAYATGAFAEFRKWVVRNRATAASLAAALLLLIAGFVTSSTLWARAKESETLALEQKGRADAEAARALAEAETSQRVVAFLTDMFEQQDPDRARGERVTVKEVLDVAAARIRGELEDQPAVRMALLASMSAVYRSLGLDDRARPLAEEAARLAAELHGDESREAVLARLELARLDDAAARYDEARAAYEAALAFLERTDGSNALETSRVRAELGGLLAELGDVSAAESSLRARLDVLAAEEGEGSVAWLHGLESLGNELMAQGRLDEAEPLMLRALEGLRERLGRDHPRTAVATGRFGHLKVLRGEYDEARALIEEGLETQRAALGDDHPRTLASRARLGSVTHQQGDYAQAERIQRDVLEARTRVLGPHHPDTLASRFDVAVAVRNLGRPAEAEALLREALAGLEATYGERHPKTAGVRLELGRVADVLGRLEEAEELLRGAVEDLTATVGPDEQRTLIAKGALAVVLRRRDLVDEAIALLRDVLAVHRRTLDERNPALLSSLGLLGVFLFDEDPAEAEALFREALAGQRAVLGARHPETTSTVNNLGMLYERLGRLEEAEPLLREAYEANRAQFGAVHPETATNATNLALLLGTLGREDESIALHREAFEASRSTLGERHPKTIARRRMLGGALVATGDLDEAEPLLREGLELARDALGERDDETLEHRRQLAVLLLDRGDAAAAVRELESVLAAERERGDPIRVVFALSDLGNALEPAGEHEAAAARFREAWTTAGELWPDGHHEVLLALDGLVRSLVALGRFAEAEPLAERLVERTPANAERAEARRALLERARGE